MDWECGQRWSDLHEATYQFVIAIEISLRRYLKTSIAHLMNDDFWTTLTKKIIADDDVQFN